MSEQNKFDELLLRYDRALDGIREAGGEDVRLVVAAKYATSEELDALCDAVLGFENINLRGFMTMAPKCEKKEEYLKYFQQTYQQVLDIWAKKMHNISRPIISMGMSDSFEEAILSGSDIVRVGRRLFVK